jgi:hypothetical protein
MSMSFLHCPRLDGPGLGCSASYGPGCSSGMALRKLSSLLDTNRNLTFHNSIYVWGALVFSSFHSMMGD